MNYSIRKASADDLLFLEQLERLCFPDFQRTNRRSLTLSLSSPFQEVWIIENETSNLRIGALTLFIYKKTLRIYSIGILPDYQKSGAGRKLIDHVLLISKATHKNRIVLEVYANDLSLINWYAKFGFVIKETLKDYYCPKKDAVKMEYINKEKCSSIKTSNIIVINKPHHWLFEEVNAKVVSVKEFITNEIYFNDSNIRIFNLCTSYSYQSYGYYISLLASARGQRVIPSVTTIRDFNSLGIIRSITYDINELLQNALKHIKSKSFKLEIYFGQTSRRGFKKLALKLYQLFETPMFEASFIKDETWVLKKINPISLNKINSEEFVNVNSFAKTYFDKKRFNRTRLQSYKYDLAILVNPDDPTPPSCPKAQNNLKKAANKRGIYVEFITKLDFDHINEFDALFIRETTGVNNHTYQISRLAYAEGLVVIDDPWSIVRCSNKIYQNELFRSHKIRTPQTTVFTKNLFQSKDLDHIHFPLVIKQPDSAFSLGISKANNKDEALQIIGDLFKRSDMIIAQEFLYSTFDWRIGILDNTPLFACKYFMTKNHWQIYNWQQNAEEQSGDSVTLPLSEVPTIVIETAKKAAALIGDGLYGVDLKEIDGKVYVIEVNDNPNIDAGTEDNYLHDGLYDRIIDSIYRRIESTKNLNNLLIEK